MDYEAMSIDELETLNTELGEEIAAIQATRREILAVHGEKSRIRDIQNKLGVNEATAKAVSVTIQASALAITADAGEAK